MLCKELEKERKVRYFLCLKFDGMVGNKRRKFMKGYITKSRETNKLEIIMEV